MQWKDIFHDKCKKNKKFGLCVSMCRYIEQTEINANLIFYESNFGKKVGGGPYAMFRTYLDAPEYKDFIHVWSLENIEEDPVYKVFHKNPRVKFVERQSEEYFSLLAQAKVVVNNRQFPYYYIRRENQIFVRLVQVFEKSIFEKKYRDVKEQSYMRNLIQATHLVVESETIKQEILSINHMGQWKQWRILVDKIEYWDKSKKKPVSFALELAKEILENGSEIFESNKLIQKENIIFYPGKFKNDALTRSFLHLLFYMDYSNYNIHIVLYNTDNEERQEMVNKIDERAIVHIKYGAQICLEEEFACLEELKSSGTVMKEDEKLLKSYFQREFRRIFMDMNSYAVFNYAADSTWWTGFLSMCPTEKKYIYLHKFHESVMNNDCNKETINSLLLINRFKCVLTNSLISAKRILSFFKMNDVEVQEISYFLNEEKVLLESLTKTFEVQYEEKRYTVIQRKAPNHHLLLEGYRSPQKEKKNYIYNGFMENGGQTEAVIKLFLSHKKQHSIDILYILINKSNIEKLEQIVEDFGGNDSIFFVENLDNPYSLMKQCNAVYGIPEDSHYSFEELEAIALKLDIIKFCESKGPVLIKYNANRINIERLNQQNRLVMNALLK